MGKEGLKYEKTRFAKCYGGVKGEEYIFPFTMKRERGMCMKKTKKMERTLTTVDS